MFLIIKNIVMVLFFLGVLAFIPYVIWVIITLFKKQWQKLLKLIVFPVILYYLLIYLYIFASHGKSKRDMVEVFDSEVNVGKAVFVYDSPRAFNGDGYSLYVYDLPDSVRERFEKADSILLGEYPRLPDYRKGWKTVTWKEAPFEQRFEKYFDFALCSCEDDLKLDRQIEVIRRSIKNKRTFYSFFKKDHGEYPGNIDLFIVDLTGSKLIIINHNT